MTNWINGKKIDSNRREIITAWINGEEIEYEDINGWKSIKPLEEYMDSTSILSPPQCFALFIKCRIKNPKKEQPIVEFDELYEKFEKDETLNQKFRDIILNKARVLERFLSSCVNKTIDTQNITNSNGDKHQEEYNKLLAIYQRYHS